MSRRGQRIRDWMGGVDRSVTPVIATILIVALVIVIAASFGAVAFGFTDRLGGTSVAANDDQCLQSVDFDPNDIDSFADSATADIDCVLWYDASQESYTPGTDVTSWTDRSGNGFDAGMSGLVGPPTYVGEVDGVDAIEFDGSSGEGLNTDPTTKEMGISPSEEFTITTLVRPAEN